MSTTTEYLSVTDTARLLRAALKAEFPGVKFSVRSDRYAGGASIRVYWTDGPTDDAVSATAGLYQGATFDGMQDLKEYHASLLAGPDGTVREVHFGADFVFTERSFSPAFLAAAESFITAQGRRGRLTTPERCAGCGNWMAAESQCWAVRGRYGREFVDDPRCGAIIEARYGHIRPKAAR